MIDFDNSPVITNLRPSPSKDRHPAFNFPNDPLMTRLGTFTTKVEGNFRSLSTLAKSAQTRSFNHDLLGTGHQSPSAA